ncbi:MAG TPA: oligosaccharide flippase family protein [Jatrophihabitantaceae bacterium]|nr:oligosaccharide flippase family protein [Jatrophihabitantaceae bacterium]
MTESASFSVLLPAEPAGPVVIAASQRLATALAARFPGAIVLHRESAVRPDGQSLVWDGGGCPLAPGSVALLVVDSRVASVAVLRPALAPDGTLAVLGRRGSYVLATGAEHAERIWRRGWDGPPAVGRGALRLAIEGPAVETLAERIGSQLRGVVGERLELIGVQGGRHTLLHYRGSRDWAVRISLADPACEVAPSTRIGTQVPAAARFLPRTVLRARTCGRPWVATQWIRQDGAVSRRRRRGNDDPWEAFTQLAGALQTRVTGRTSAGWSTAWCASAALLAPERRQRFAAVLARLDDGVPTGWCHGDPRPSNVLRHGADVTVIGWGNAADDAPLGLDWLLTEATRIAHDERVPMAVACLHADGIIATEGGALADREIAGRRWADWDRPHRIALALAAYVLYLRGRPPRSLDSEHLEADLAAIDEVLDQDADCAATAASAPSARRTARGAMWLGLSAAVAKAGQTIVMFVLAAVLQPSALGLLAIGWLVVNVVSAFADLGCSSALVYWRGDVERAARSALSVSLGLSLVLAAGCWLAAPWLAAALNASDGGVGVIRGLTCVLPCYAITDITQELLRREFAFARRVVPTVLATVCGIAVTLGLLARGGGIEAMVIGQIVQGVVAALLSWVVRRPVRPGWRWQDVRGLIGYGGHLAGGSFAQLMLLNVDYIIVAHALGATRLGEYSLAFRIAYLPFYNIAAVICTAAFPHLCRVRGAVLGRAASEVAATGLGLVIPIFAAIALFAPLLQLLGDDWTAAVPALRWLCCYGVLLSVIQLCQNPLNAAGRPRDSLVLRALHVLLLAGVLALVVHRGITAVAIGQVVAAAMIAIVALALVWRQVTGMLDRDLARAVLPSLLGAAAMTAVVLPIQLAVPSIGVSVPAHAGLAAAAVAAFALPVWLLDRERVVRTVRLIGARS